MNIFVFEVRETVYRYDSFVYVFSAFIVAP